MDAGTVNLLMTLKNGINTDISDRSCKWLSSQRNQKEHGGCHSITCVSTWTRYISAECSLKPGKDIHLKLSGKARQQEDLGLWFQDQLILITWKMCKWIQMISGSTILNSGLRSQRTPNCSLHWCRRIRNLLERTMCQLILWSQGQRTLKTDFGKDQLMKISF